MARFIVTSGSHFQPLTYDELIKPLAQMTEAQNNAQAAYDQISMETNALENYITQNPEDERARELYDNYKNKLTTLQSNLWNNGYSSQTARDLSAARAGYASDITRLSTAIKNRQERSKEYWDMRHKNPDMVAGNDPGASGLDNYLDNDRFGQDYFNYSGRQFTTEVATDAQARAKELRNTELGKNPKAVGYLERIDKEGYTANEVQNASNAAEAILMNGADRKAILDSMELPERILTETLLSHMESTGAQVYGSDAEGNTTGNLSEDEYRRLFEYGKQGLAHAIGNTKTSYMGDNEYAYNKQVAMENLRFQHQRQAAAEDFQYKMALAGMKNGNGDDIMQLTEEQMNDPDLRRKRRATINKLGGYHPVLGGINHKKAQQNIKDWFGENTLVTTKDRQGNPIGIHNKAEASDLVYSFDRRNITINEIGIDPGRTPGSDPRDRNSMIYGECTRDGVDYETRVVPTKKGLIVQKRVKNDNLGINEGWDNDPNMTKFYNRMRDEIKETSDYYKVNNPELFKMATYTPDKQYDLYKKEGFGSRNMSLSNFIDSYSNEPANKERFVGGGEYMAMGTSKNLDGGNYIGKLNDLLSFTIHGGSGKNKEWKGFKDSGNGIHTYNKNADSPDRKSLINPDSIFHYDNRNVIDNINQVIVNARSISNGYIIVGTNKGPQLYTVGANMLNHDGVKHIFEQGQRDIDAILHSSRSQSRKDEDIADIEARVASELRSELGYVLHTQAEGDTNKDDNN